MDRLTYKGEELITRLIELRRFHKLGMFVIAAAKAFNIVNMKGSNRDLWEDRGSKTDGFDVLKRLVSRPLRFIRERQNRASVSLRRRSLSFIGTQQISLCVHSSPHTCNNLFQSAARDLDSDSSFLHPPRSTSPLLSPMTFV